ncbi:LOW QUALITY PROTEIN: hypothetical protein U9M48_013619 [Paspalum notatum var. saurae]
MLINFVYILCFGLNYMVMFVPIIVNDIVYSIMLYLFDLKSQVRNKARPEGCIAESVLAKEAMALCSGFLEGFEALHSRLSQNDDDDESFVRKAKKLCYKRAHAEEIATKHNRHRINHREVEKFQNDKFHEWFRVHMLQLERENSIRGVNNDKIRWLARGPVEAAKRYLEAAKTSSYASASDTRPVLGDVTYYGRIIDIIELTTLEILLLYFSNANGLIRGIKRDKYGYTLVNFSHLIHTGEKIGHKPYIFPNQADQVFYIKDKLNPGWSVVMKMKPRDIYDADCDEWEGDSETEPFHVTHLEEMFINANINNQWVRTDIEGTTVDASTNGFDNQS